MTNRNDRGKDRAGTARRNDDSDIINKIEEGPSHSGAKGGNFQRDIGSRDEMAEQVTEGDGNHPCPRQRQARRGQFSPLQQEVTSAFSPFGK